MCTWKECVFCCLGWNVLNISIRYICSNVSFRGTVSCLISCLNDLSIDVSEMLKSSTIIVLLFLPLYFLLAVLCIWVLHIWCINIYNCCILLLDCLHYYYMSVFFILFYFILFYFIILFFSIYEIYCQIGCHTTPSAHPKRCPPQYPSQDS